MYGFLRPSGVIKKHMVAKNRERSEQMREERQHSLESKLKEKEDRTEAMKKQMKRVQKMQKRERDFNIKAEDERRKKQVTDLEMQKKLLQGNFYDKDEVDKLPLDVALKIEMQKQSRELVELEKQYKVQMAQANVEMMIKKAENMRERQEQYKLDQVREI